MTLKLRLTAIGLAAAGLAAGIGAFAAEHSLHQYPPPFPRPGAVKVLENDRVVVWDVTWPKGVRGPVHEHYRDAVIVTLTGGTIEKFPLHGKRSTVTYKSGSVIFAPKGVIHSEEGISDAPRHAFVIELK
jgi:quercetin dioxygenase-like cupin family protein